MRRSLFLVTLVIAMLGAFASAPSAGAANSIKLHPSGFGTHSYSSWKAGEGEVDRTGSKDQALYFQKMTATTTNAAGIAVFEGVAGMDAEDLFPLAFDRRLDGHCGAGAPRFNLRVEDPSTQLRQTIFIGCAGMAPSAAQETGWERRSTGLLVPPAAAGMDVVSLSIVFDEGNDVGQGYVYLDNIQVGSHIWTSASDNGGGNTVVTAAEAQSILGEPFSVALG